MILIPAAVIVAFHLLEYANCLDKKFRPLEEEGEMETKLSNIVLIFSEKKNIISSLIKIKHF